MKKILCATLLIAVSMRAQTSSSSQATAPAGPEVEPQAPPSQLQPPARTLRNEAPIREEARKRLQDLGYFNDEQPQVAPVKPTIPYKEEVRKRLFNAGQPQAAPAKPTIPCAIPLQGIPMPESRRFTIETAPANPSMDPKIVQTPALPACVKSVSPVVTPPEPAQDQK